MSDDSTTEDTTTEDTTQDVDTSKADDTAAQRSDEADETNISIKDKFGDVDWQKAARRNEARAKSAESRAKENAAAAKELAELKKSQMSEIEKAQASAKEVTERAEAAERRAALLQAAVDHKLDKDDLALLDGVPADQIEDRAKKLAARLQKAGTTSSSGGEVNGGGAPKKPTSLDSAVAAHYSQQ